MRVNQAGCDYAAIGVNNDTIFGKLSLPFNFVGFSYFDNFIASGSQSAVLN